MKKIIVTLALGTLAAVPASTLQSQTGQPAAAVPHTVHSEMMVFRAANYNGEDQTVETPSSEVHTDWPIRSIAVHPGDSWQICARSRYREPCIILNRSVPDASLIGVDDQIGSARLAPAAAPAPH
jgi:hypothetical protein